MVLDTLEADTCQSNGLFPNMELNIRIYHELLTKPTLHAVYGTDGGQNLSQDAI